MSKPLTVSVETHGVSDPKDWLGCGVKSHHPDCLCDVVITTIAPVTIENGTADIFMGSEIAELRGYCVPWTTTKMLDYFTDVVMFHDTWVDSGLKKASANRTDGRGKERTAWDWKMTRAGVRGALMNTPKPKIRVVLATLGYTVDEFMCSATTGKFTMTASQLDLFEERVLAGVTNMAQLGRDFNMSTDTARNLYKYWNIPYTTVYTYNGSKGNEVPRARIKELILAGYKPREVSDMLMAEFGYQVSRHTVSKTKARYLKQLMPAPVTELRT